MNCHRCNGSGVIPNVFKGPRQCDQCGGSGRGDCCGVETEYYGGPVGTGMKPAVPSKLIRAGFACPHCGARHPPDGMCTA